MQIQKDSQIKNLDAHMCSYIFKMEMYYFCEATRDKPRSSTRQKSGPVFFKKINNAIVSIQSVTSSCPVLQNFVNRLYLKRLGLIFFIMRTK